MDFRELGTEIPDSLDQVLFLIQPVPKNVLMVAAEIQRREAVRVPAWCERKFGVKIWLFRHAYMRLTLFFCRRSLGYYPVAAWCDGVPPLLCAAKDGDLHAGPPWLLLLNAE